MYTTYSRRLSLFVLLFSIQFLWTSTSSAQFEWPERSENLQVLPESTSGEQLSNIMRSWTDALGVRCSHCHVGQGPLSEYDFVSDEKEAKEKTREMMRMTRAINAEYINKLTELDNQEAERVRVGCITCHRNVAKPMALEAVLASTYQKAGIEEVFTHYDELREAYYGGFAYDFREGVLTRLGEQMSEQGHHQEALQVLDKEIELHDEFADVYMVQGQIWIKLDEPEKALTSYEKGKSLASPRASRRFQERIDQLKDQ